MTAKALKNTIIEQATQALLAAAPAGSRVILFGSHARGLAREDSDLDFLVVEPNVVNRFTESVRLRKSVDQALGGIAQPMDVIVIDREQFMRKATVPNTLAYEAATYGRVYE